MPAPQGDGFVVIAFDASQRVALEQTIHAQLEALQEADRYKDDFLTAGNASA